MSSGFDIAAGRLIDFADKSLHPMSDTVLSWSGQTVPGFCHISDLAWPNLDGGLRATYNATCDKFLEALDALGHGLERSAQVLKAGAKEYEKLDGQISDGLQG